MPFDVRDFQAAGDAGPESIRRSRRAVAASLSMVCGMILVMIGLGGAIRLTGSVQSIMDRARASLGAPGLCVALPGGRVPAALNAMRPDRGRTNPARAS